MTPLLTCVLAALPLAPPGRYSSDVENLVGKPAYVRLVGFGFWKPKVRILGSDVAGRVTAVGGKVTRLRPGDEVLADTLMHGLGGFAEYVAVPEAAPMVRKPEGLSFEAAAGPVDLEDRQPQDGPSGDRAQQRGPGARRRARRRRRPGSGDRSPLPLGEAAAALRRVAAGEARGKVVITM